MLSDLWRDIISIGGFLLTFAGLLYTMRQVWLAKTAAQAAKAAAYQTLFESRRSFQRYAAANAHRFINEAHRFNENKHWTLAAMRLSDLADQLAQLASLNPALKRRVTAVRKWERHCSEMAQNEATPFGGDKWVRFSVTLQSAIDNVHGPFAGEGGSNDRQ